MILFLLGVGIGAFVSGLGRVRAAELAEQRADARSIHEFQQRRGVLR